MSSQELDHSKTTLRTLIYKVQTINISKPNASSLWNTVLNLMVSLMTCVSTFTTAFNVGTNPGQGQDIDFFSEFGDILYVEIQDDRWDDGEVRGWPLRSTKCNMALCH